MKSCSRSLGGMCQACSRCRAPMLRRICTCCRRMLDRAQQEELSAAWRGGSTSLDTYRLVEDRALAALRGSK